MRISILAILSMFFWSSIYSQENAYLTIFEKSGGTETATYQEGIQFYQQLAEKFPEVQMRTMGLTDSGHPLHLVLYSKSKNFDIASLKAEDKVFVLINNAIHPGEPDGVEASMMMLRDIVLGRKLNDASEDFVLAIIPFYNIGGVLNRNSTTRANQEGPKEYGFRGNSRHFDLNRDFIKNDTRNSSSFAEIYHTIDPDLFLDTHVSNGADYQYTITLVSTQSDKLGGSLQRFQDEHLLPFLYSDMQENDFPMTPYVNVFGRTPDKGWNQFPDWPRYSSGYTALFQSIGMMSETHMLKPFDKRVEATYNLMSSLLTSASKFSKEILTARRADRKSEYTNNKYPVTWKLDTSRSTTLQFKGYEGKMVESKVTSQQRLFYDKNQPFTKEVKYYNAYMPNVEILAPKAYVIPKGWHTIVEVLKRQKVEMYPLYKDSLIDVSTYYIEDFETVRNPYEGHYMHYNVSVRKETGKALFKKGDWVIAMNQKAKRYLIEVLEPQGEDALFKWNYFDSILQRKEGFSSYVFEEKALEMLETDAELKQIFESKKQNEPDFAKSRYAQLNFLYSQSDHAEKEYNRYPVFRIEEN